MSPEVLLFIALAFFVIVASIALDERDRQKDARESRRRNQARPWE